MHHRLSDGIPLTGSSYTEAISGDVDSGLSRLKNLSPSKLKGDYHVQKCTEHSKPWVLLSICSQVHADNYFVLIR